MEAIQNLAGAAMLLLGLLLPTRRRHGSAARLAAWQGGLLALAAACAAWSGTEGAILWALAFAALAGRALLLPALLRLATARGPGGALPRGDSATQGREDGEAFPFDGGAPPQAGSGALSRVGDSMHGRLEDDDLRLGGEAFPRAGGDAWRRGAGGAHQRGGGAAAPVRSASVSLLAGGGLAVLAVAAVVPAGAGMASGTREGFALALAVLLAGLLTMALRRGVAFGLLGLLAAENGALLGLVHAGAAAPGATALAVVSPGLVACAALAAARVGGGVPLVQALLQAIRR